MKYIIAIDGGGSKTQGAIFRLPITSRKPLDAQSLSTIDVSTAEKSITVAGSSLTASFDGACQVISNLIENLVGSVNADSFIVSVGVAGAGQTELAQKLTNTLTSFCEQQGLPLSQCFVMEDCVSALFGTVLINHLQDTSLITMGTGSFIAKAVGVHNNSNQQNLSLNFSGGWGFPIGDEGGGARLGQLAVQNFIAQFESDNTPPLTNRESLTSAFITIIGDNKENILAWLAKASAAEFAALAPLVIQYKDTCPVAKTSWEQHLELVKTLITKAQLNPADIKSDSSNSNQQTIFVTGGLAKVSYDDLSSDWLNQNNLVIQLLEQPSLMGALAFGVLQSDHHGDVSIPTQKVFESFSKYVQCHAVSCVASGSNSSSGSSSTGDSSVTTDKVNELTPLSQLVSESRNPNSMDLDTLNSQQIVRLMNQQDAHIAQAVNDVSTNIAQAIDIIVEQMQSGGRLIYMGAGTSGRLGVLDAVECPPTFSSRSTDVIGLIAGGNNAMFKAVEGAEDSEALAEQDLSTLELTAHDVVVGIAASGRTPYVIGGIKYAQKIGAKTLSVTCNPTATINQLSDLAIAVNVGPEVLTGSTRLKAGTAQKLILNMLSTGAFVRLGKCYQNLMVDVNVSNIKLKQRAIRIIEQATRCSTSQAQQWLEAANNKVKPAILMALTQSDLNTATQMLNKHAGQLRQAIADFETTNPKAN